jgi:hypothetical protein
VLMLVTSKPNLSFEVLTNVCACEWFKTYIQCPCKCNCLIFIYVCVSVNVKLCKSILCCVK